METRRLWATATGGMVAPYFSAKFAIAIDPPGIDEKKADLPSTPETFDITRAPTPPIAKAERVVISIGNALAPRAIKTGGVK